MDIQKKRLIYILNYFMIYLLFIMYVFLFSAQVIVCNISASEVINM